MKRWNGTLAAALAAVVVSACGGGAAGSATAGSNPQPQQNVVVAAQAHGGATTLIQAMNDAQLVPTMETAKAVTLLAPSDAALAPYAADLAELESTGDTAALQDFVNAHAVDGTVLSTALQQIGAAAAAQVGSGPSFITNILGEQLDVDFEDGQLTINGADPGDLDLLAENGCVQFLNGSLFAPSVYSVVRNNPQTKTLAAAIRAAGLKSTLAGKGSFTLFAPTDTAFANLLKELNLTADQLLGNKPLLTQVLTYHVLASRLLARDVVDGETPTTVEGQFITLDATGKGRKRTIQITDARGRVANSVKTNIRARNGVVHLIDRVILPTDQDVVAVAAANPDFSILVAAVQAAGLVNTLQGNGPFTVFAPTNEAFAALLTELNITQDALLANKPLLTSVLTYHVLASRVLASDITDGLAESTVEGQPIVLHNQNGALSIVDARGRTADIVIKNVQASNGVVHAIDRVILPTTSNLVQVAAANPDFSVLVQAVTAAGLADTLSGPGPYTVFAPTNEAFAKLLTDLGVTEAQLLADKALLTKVLTYHVVPAEVISSAIPFDKPITTVEGETFTINRSLQITDQSGRTSNIIATDVAATNGVIHVIDTVLLPK